MEIRTDILLGYIGIAAMFIFGLFIGTYRAAAQEGSCQSNCTPEVMCNSSDGSPDGHHSGGGCSYNNACTCWCSTETCATAKSCGGNGTFQYCGVQEACESYANGTLSHCLNISGC